MNRVVVFVILMGMLAFASLTSWAVEPKVEWQFTDIDGRIHKPFEDEATRGIALIFISTDCPIANSYQPQLQRLAAAHAKNGIRLFMIHPSRDVTLEEARQHAAEFKIESRVVIDADQSIARRVGATVTPQAFVFARDQKAPFYEGRIDDLYAALGKKRGVATTHDLADALTALIDGRPVEHAKTQAVGCYISYED
jgi:hypothetical protein